MICASLSLLHPLLSLTHWIFGSLMLPYKSSSLVQLMSAVHAIRRRRRSVDWTIEIRLLAKEL